MYFKIEIILDSVGGSQVITRVLKSRKENQKESQRDVTMEDQRDTTLLALKIDKGSREPRNVSNL